MQTIKPRSHKYRSKVIDQLIPIIKRHYGKNFIALVAEGSYGRGEDKEYSDLELTVFLKKLSKKDEVNIKKVVDGMLIVVCPDTKEDYIKNYLDISDVWYASGVSYLFPIVNKSYIEGINAFKPKNVRGKCRQQIQKRWPRYYEITTKVLKNILHKDQGAATLAFADMVKELLILLAYLNATPYKNLDSYIPQARKFKIKPKSFNGLIQLFVTGSHHNLFAMGRVTKKVFSEMGLILRKERIRLTEKKFEF